MLSPFPILPKTFDRGTCVGALGGVPIYVHRSYLISMIWVSLPTFTWGPVHYGLSCLLVTLSIFTHEYAHGAVAKACGLRVEAISLVDGGGWCFHEATGSKAIDNLVLVAGPLANLALACVFYLWSGLSSEPLIKIGAATNLIMAAANLAPSFYTDGGVILFSFLREHIPERWAATIVGSIGLMMHAVAVVAMFVLAISGFPMTFGAGRDNWAVLDEAWREPATPTAPSDATRREVPQWLIRHPPDSVTRDLPSR